ncbi:MAG: DUF2272 domain-containing protein, partial [Cyanobacteria bacterium J06606_4]
FDRKVLDLCTALATEREYWEEVKTEIVRIALNEYSSIWSNGTKKEQNEDMKSAIKDYWTFGPYSDTQSPPKWIKIPSTAWSAAFISWVVNKAGGEKRFSKVSDEISYRTYKANNEKYIFRPTAHCFYATIGKINREVGDSINPFWTFSSEEVKPSVGDIVVDSRVDYKALDPELGIYRTHGDIVVEISGNKMTVVGGNISNSVTKRSFTLDANGFIKKKDFSLIVRIQSSIFEWSECDNTVQA